MKNDGGNAFPMWHPELMNTAEFGMSLRDYFASKATEEDITEVLNDHYCQWQDSNTTDSINYNQPSRSQARYMHADLMLEARLSY